MSFLAVTGVAGRDVIVGALHGTSWQETPWVSVLRPPSQESGPLSWHCATFLTVTCMRIHMTTEANVSQHNLTARFSLPFLLVKKCGLRPSLLICVISPRMGHSLPHETLLCRSLV